MDVVNIIQDSVDTSVTLKLFTSRKSSMYYHIFHSSYVKFPLSQLKTLDNFDTKRLSGNPYPKENRPRGQADLDSVLHHRRIVQQQGSTEPIWIVSKKGTYTLLDGAHRIVATYLEGKRTIPAYIVHADE
jgi:ParB-like nuclease domain